MDKKFAGRLKQILILAVLVNLFIIVMQGFSTVKTIDSSKKGLMLIGQTALSTFEGGRRAQLLLNPNSAQRFRSFVDMIGENSGVKSLYLFDQDGTVLFNTKEITPPEIQPKDTPNGIFEVPDGLFMYQTLPPPRHMMGGMQGRGGWQDNESPRHLVAGVLLDTSSYKAMVRSEILFVCGMVFLELLLIAVYVYAARVIRLNADQTRRLHAAEHEAELGKMSRVMAHELKNPLSSVKGLMEFSAKKAEGSLQDIAVRCVDELSRLDRIINDYLSYGKDMTLNISETDVKAIAENTKKLLEIDAQSKDIGINISGDGSIIKADSEKMRQVIFNLMLNAIQGSPEGSDVEIYSDSRTMRITNVIASADFEHENLGKPFYTTKTVGTGLGLAIVKRICKLHGFDTEINSDKLFSVTISFK